MGFPNPTSLTRSVLFLCRYGGCERWAAVAGVGDPGPAGCAGLNASGYKFSWADRAAQKRFVAAFVKTRLNGEGISKKMGNFFAEML